MDVIDSIPKLMRDEKNIEDAQKEGNELFLDVCESFRYGVMSYGSEQAVPREVEMQRIIQAIPDNTLKYQRYLELTAKRASDIVFTISRRRGDRSPQLPVLPFPRWDEKAGLPRDALSSQCSTCSRHKEKETGNAED